MKSKNTANIKSNLTFFGIVIGLYILADPGYNKFIQILNNKSRKLNAKEIKFAQGIFGNTINYNEVALHQGAKGIIAHDLTTVAQTSDNDIYFRAKHIDINKLDDPSEQAVLIHELHHVHQHQNNNFFKTYTDGLYRQFVKYTNKHGYAANYELDLRKIKTYSECSNDEQEALVVQRYSQSLLDFNRLVEKTYVDKDEVEFRELLIVDSYLSLSAIHKFIGNALPLTSFKDVDKKLDEVNFTSAKFKQNIQEIRQLSNDPNITALDMLKSDIVNSSQTKFSF